MRFYCIDDTALSFWAGTLGEARRIAKSGTADGKKFMRDWVRIEEVEVPTDKAGVLALLNGTERNEKTLRVWSMTDRGGLRIVNEEEE